MCSTQSEYQLSGHRSLRLWILGIFLGIVAIVFYALLIIIWGSYTLRHKKIVVSI